MAWKIKISERAEKALKKMERSTSQKIYRYLTEVQSLDNPRDRGKFLSGNLAGLWRYRVGDCRIICEIFNSELLVLVIDIDHRDKVYD